MLADNDKRAEHRRLKDSFDAKLSVIKLRCEQCMGCFLAGCAAHHGRYRDLKWSLAVCFICVPLSPAFRNFETTSTSSVVAFLTHVRGSSTFANIR